MNFLKDKTGYWLIDEGLGRVYNQAGDFKNYTPREDDEIIAAAAWSDLDWTEFVEDPKSPYGWIDRNGNFYGCAKFNHSLMADMMFGLNERALEIQGWVKVHAEYPTNRPSWCCEKTPTEEQFKTLEDLGFDIN